MNDLKPIYFPNGLTVKELKEAIKSWPETNNDGKDNTVLVEHTSGLISPVIEICPLDKRESIDGKITADIIFCCD